MSGVKSDLFGFREKVVRVSIQHHLADDLHRNLRLRNEFGCIQNVESQFAFLASVDDLHTQLPLREVAAVDRLPKIAPVKVAVFAGDFLRFIPRQPMYAEFWLPVELDEMAIATRIDKAKRVNAKAFHHPEASRHRAVRHGPHQHVRGFRHQRCKVPERVVRARRLRHAVMGLGLDSVNQVRKLDRILNKKHRNVVSHQVVIAFAGVELDRKPAHIPDGVGRTLRTSNGRKPDKDRRFHRRVLQEAGTGVLHHRLVNLEIAVGTRPSGMHDALWNSLMVEVRNFFPEDEVFQQCRPAQTSLQRIVVVRNL